MAKKTAAKTEKGLNLQQERFCQVYTSNDKELFGNGALSYLEVYGEEHIAKYKKQMTYAVAVVNASRLLTKAKIIERINELLETGGFNDENVDKQHLFLLNQHADLKTKLGAIREYNVLRKRIDNTVRLVVTPSAEEKEKVDSVLRDYLKK